MPTRRPLAPSLLPTTLLVALLLAAACARPEAGSPPLAAAMPLHLEEHLASARIVGSEAPVGAPAAVAWRFDELQPDWKVFLPRDSDAAPIAVTRVDDALRLTLIEANRDKLFLGGAICVDLPDWKPEDWAHVVVRARTSDEITTLAVRPNLHEEASANLYAGFVRGAGSARPVGDGAVHSYLIPVTAGGEITGDWKQLGIWVAARKPAAIDLISVTMIPIAADFARAPAGVRTETRNDDYRRVLYTHTPGGLEYRLRVPEGGRLDFGMGVLSTQSPVTFRVIASAEGSEETLFSESYADRVHWAQRTVDLSPWAGKTITLTLDAEAERTGTVALWAAPTLSGVRMSPRPNVILYVIDGGGAEYLTPYGYNRRTTPNLERLAAAGALFVNAYSTATWTKPSNMSFMTSLHHSVFGGFERPTDLLPENALTMAQHMHRAGYQTAVFAANPWCGTMSGFEREVDVLRESIPDRNAVSSRRLHGLFRKWRQHYPGEPYWAHFQTIDTHSPRSSERPFAGLFISSERRRAWEEWDRRLQEERVAFLTARGRGERPSGTFYERAGVDRQAHFEAERDVFDETMASTDHQLGQLVEWLKVRGEWERTLWILTADHGAQGLEPPAGGDSKGRGAKLDPFATRVPLVVIWPGHVAAGQRFYQPVSLIDLLPTVLDLAGLPPAEGVQGQSLAPLLRGRGEWTPQPVIIDDFMIGPTTGKPWGTIEVIDGRWGASLQVGAPDDEPPPEEPLLVFDLWDDPFCQRSIHEERPDLVEKYTDFLEKRLQEHRDLGRSFPRPDPLAISTGQLEALRTLGYVE